MLTLNNSQFQSALFDHCKLLGIDWTQADWAANLGHSPMFKHCLLNAGSFFGLTLNALKIIDCKAHDVDFTEARLNNAQFGGSELARSRFHNTDLSQADFSRAQGYHIDIRHNELNKARFSSLEALSLLSSSGILLVD